MAAVAHNGKAKPEVTLERWLQALARETQRAYRTWLERYGRWCTENGADPDAAASVAAYIEHIVRQGYGVSAVQQLLAALRLKFRSQGVKLEDPELALLLRQVRRTLGVAPRRAKRPFTLEMLERVQWRPGLVGIRDRALMLVGFYGALRIRELVGLNIEDITEQKEGFVVAIWRSKTDQEGRGRFVAIPRGGRLGPAEALKAWLTVLREHDYTSGALFRYAREKRLFPARMTVQAAQNVVKLYAAQLGYNPRDFAGHSLRAGFVTSAALRNAPEEAIAADRSPQHRCSAQLHPACDDLGT
jgi:site-specific recombinase XerD